LAPNATAARYRDLQEIAMSRSLVLFSILLLAPPVALAETSPLELAFSNTIVSTYPDGRKAKLWLNRDGSYRAQGRRGRPSSGRWTLKGERICLKQSRPFPGPFSYCTTVKRGGVGAKWTGKAVTGEPIRIELVGGR
jgi:hypothetical protein